MYKSKKSELERKIAKRHAVELKYAKRLRKLDEKRRETADFILKYV